MILPVLRNKVIPLRVRKKIGKIYPIPQEREFDMPMFGHTYSGRTGSHMDNKIYLYGLHEPATIHLMRTILISQHNKGQKTVYMDIGTNVGMHLIALADLIDEGYGFEPWGPVRDIATSKLENNKISNIKVFDFGLSNENGSCPFVPPANNNYGVGSFDPELRDNEDSLSLQIRKGDDVTQTHNIAPTLMKMDVEGHEKYALEGLQETIAQHSPVIIFEYAAKSREDLGNPETLEKLFGKQYHFFGIKRSREFPKLVPFNPKNKYENVLAYPGKKPDFSL